MVDAVKPLLAALLVPMSAAAAPIPVSAAFDGIRIETASISNDGRYLALVLRDGVGKSFVVIKDRTTREPPKPVIAANENAAVEPKHCGWASAKRVICRLTGTAGAEGSGDYIQRYVAVDGDGSNRFMLLEPEFQRQGRFSSPWIVDYKTHDDDHVVVRYRNYGNNVGTVASRYPTIALLNVHDGRIRELVKGEEPLTVFATDGNGAAFLGVGVQEGLSRGTNEAHARLAESGSWKRLKRLDSHASDVSFTPVAVVPGTNDAFMLLDKDGRVALWKVDLLDQRDPTPLFWHTDFNIAWPVVASHERLLGVRLASSAIGVQYTDPDAQRLDATLRAKWPHRNNDIISHTPDFKTVVVRTWGGVEPPAYHVYSERDGAVRFDFAASTAPELAKLPLQPMRHVVIPTSEGRRVFAQLTTPPAPAGVVPPLVVVLGDWRDQVYQFDPLAQLLVSRGFAVLRPQYAQTAQGTSWDVAAYLDWQGSVYADVIAAYKWVADQKLADASKSCVVGYGYGGYVALLAASRPDNQFRCAAAVNGFSDLDEPRREARIGATRQAASFGANALPASPDQPPAYRNVADAHAAVLLVHSEERLYYSQARESQSESMVSALKRAKKPHRFVPVRATEEAFALAAFEALVPFVDEHLGDAKQ